MADPITRRRLLLSDLHPDHFRKVTETIDGKEVCRIVPAPAYQIIPHGTDPNSTGILPKNGGIAFAKNGTTISRTWVYDKDSDTWLGD